MNARNVLGVVLLAVLMLGCPLAPEVPLITLEASSLSVGTEQTVTLTAAASDGERITRVALYEGEVKLAEGATLPFIHQIAFTAVSNGTHRYTARAYDAEGNEGTSNEVSVVVEIDVVPPVVSITASSFSVVVAGPVTLTATATDNKKINGVEFFEGNTRLGEDTSPPFVHVVTFALADNGGHSYTARAFDSSGNEAFSAPVTVNVAIAPPPSPPVLALSFSLKSLRFTWAPVATATTYQLFEDSDGAGSGGFVQRGANLVSTTVDLPISIHRSNLSQGRYHLRACNDSGCSAPSNELGAAGALIEAIGYFKASDSSADARFGETVALSGDGETMGVAGRSLQGGAVYVFTHVGGTWAQQTVVVGSNTAADDQFGYALAFSEDGNTLAVGAYGEDSAATGQGSDPLDDSAPYAGSVYVFRRLGTVWTQQAWLKASNTASEDYFGLSVSLSADGSILAVGASGEDSSATGVDGDQASNGTSLSGAVYIFGRTGNSWAQQAYLKASNPGTEDRFGAQVALSGSGTTLAVAAIYESSSAVGVDGNQADDNAINAGAVYIFERGSSWAQQAYLKASNTGGGDTFGSSLALSRDGQTLAVGASREDSASTGVNAPSDENAMGSGAVYIFTRIATSWSQQAWLKASNTGAGDAFGVSVALSADGSVLAIGAEREGSAARGVGGDQLDDSSESGAAYVFKREAAWSQQAYVKASNNDLTGGSRFGHWISLSSDGDTLAVSANQERSAATGIGGNQFDTSLVNAGAVYLY